MERIYVWPLIMNLYPWGAGFMITFWGRDTVLVNFAAPWTHNSNRGNNEELNYLSPWLGCNFASSSSCESFPSLSSGFQIIVVVPQPSLKSGVSEPAELLLFNIGAVVLYSKNTAISCVSERDRHGRNKMRNYWYTLFCNVFPKCLICLSAYFWE